jgi:hypothetical protein
MRRPWLPLALAALPLALVAALLPADGFYCMDAGPKALQTVALLESREVPRAFPYPGRDLDPEGDCLPDSMVRAGSGAVSLFPVLLPVLSAPAYALGGGRALLLVPFFGAVAAAWLVGRLARRLAGPAAEAPAAVTALLATPLAFYALTYWEHAPACALALGALLALARGCDGEGGAASWWLGGALLALAAGMRSELVVLLPLALAPVVVAASRRRLAGVLTAAAGVAAGVGAIALLQRAVLGAWLPLHVTHNAALGKLPLHLPGEWVALLAKFFAPDGWCGAAAILWAAALIVAVLPGLRRRRAIALPLALAAAVAPAAAALLPAAVRWLGGVRPTAAFFPHAATPTWLALAPLPAVLLLSAPAARRPARVLLGGAAVWLVAASALLWPLPQDTAQWGARQWLPALCLGIALLFGTPADAGAHRRARAALLGGALVSGALVTALGVALLLHAVRGNGVLVARLLAATGPGEAVVTDTMYLPEFAAWSWRQRTFLYCRDRAVFTALVDRMAAARVATWSAAWVESPADRRHALPDDGEMRAVDGTRWELAGALVEVVGSRELHVTRYRLAAPVTPAPPSAGQPTPGATSGERE